MMATVTSTHRHTQESLTCTQISLLVAGTKVEIATPCWAREGGKERPIVAYTLIRLYCSPHATLVTVYGINKH